MILLALLAFLIPLTIYLLFLASVNSRPTPILVPGSWDTVGLVFAASGFLLAGGPVILAQMYFKNFLSDKQILSMDDFLETWGVVILCYWGLIAAGVAALIMLRRNRTILYNIDSDRFEKIFPQLVDFLGYAAVQRDGGWLIGAPSMKENASTGIQVLAPPPSSAFPAGAAGVHIQGFAPLCHVTMHWRDGTLDFQAEFEKALRQHLNLVRADNNPAGGWLLGLAGMLFGALLLLAVFLVMSMSLTRRPW